MDLSTIEVPPDVARARLAEYEEALRHERNAQDEALAVAYRAAARGNPVIQLSKTIKAGGFFPSGLPRLAVVRADAADVTVAWESPDLVYYGPDGHRNSGALVGRDTVRVRNIGRPWPLVNPSWRGSTIAPSVPPRHRPKRPRRLSRCHLLWEVEEWTPEPPRDPALLRHIRGDLWAVLAVWDLTELERAVLAM